MADLLKITAEIVEQNILADFEFLISYSNFSDLGFLISNFKFRFLMTISDSECKSGDLGIRSIMAFGALDTIQYCTHL